MANDVLGQLMAYAERGNAEIATGQRLREQKNQEQAQTQINGEGISSNYVDMQALNQLIQINPAAASALKGVQKGVEDTAYSAVTTGQADVNQVLADIVQKFGGNTALRKTAESQYTAGTEAQLGNMNIPTPEKQTEPVSMGIDVSKTIKPETEAFASKVSELTGDTTDNVIKGINEEAQSILSSIKGGDKFTPLDLLMTGLTAGQWALMKKMSEPGRRTKQLKELSELMGATQKLSGKEPVQPTARYNATSELIKQNASKMSSIQADQYKAGESALKEILQPPKMNVTDSNIVENMKGGLDSLIELEKIVNDNPSVLKKMALPGDTEGQKIKDLVDRVFAKYAFTEAGKTLSATEKAIQEGRLPAIGMAAYLQDEMIGRRKIQQMKSDFQKKLSAIDPNAEKREVFKELLKHYDRPTAVKMMQDNGDL